MIRRLPYPYKMSQIGLDDNINKPLGSGVYLYKKHLNTKIYN